jgi:TonB family protein
MQIYKLTTNILILTLVFSVGFGCKYLSAGKITGKTTAVPTPTPAQQTVIKKDVLKQRLAAKGIETVPAPDGSGPLKPNPVTLHLRFAGSNSKFKLNQEEYGSFGELVGKLKEIFKDREAKGIFREGTNEVYQTITLPAYDEYIAEYNAQNIFVEDFEKLVDDLHKEDITEIALDLNEQNHTKFTVKELDDIPPPSPNKNVKTISGGVLNGKATDLVKPAYPSAAKAVRASGAVNVQITIDENGNVISATAVSGHPLLRASAVQAARSSKFAPTVLSGQPVKVTGVLVFNFTPE